MAKQNIVARLGVGGIMLIVAALVALAAVGVAVWRSRVPEAPIAAADAPPTGNVQDMIGALEKKLKGNTSDANGWRMLGWSYFETGRYPDAAKAYRTAATIDPTKAEYWSALGEATVLSGKAGVTADAEAAFKRALAVDPKDPRARYFIGVKKDMDGDHAGAIDDWIALLKDTPAGAPWEQSVRDLVATVAKTNKIDIAGRVPPPSTPTPQQQAAMTPPPGSGADVATAPIPGPTPEQLAQASSLPPSAQDEMVQGMVANLATRLKQNPRDAEGWMRLMRARMVLNDAKGAQTALATARATFAGDAKELARLTEAAKALGVPGA